MTAGPTSDVVLAFFRRLVLGPPPPKTRMTEEEVLALAAAALEASPLGRRIGPGLTMVSVDLRDGRVTWFVGTPTVGSGLYLMVDDATGEVGELRRWGIR